MSKPAVPKHLDDIERKKQVLLELEQQGYTKGKDVVAICQTGSRLYNLDTDNSDYDYTVIYAPSIEDLYFHDKGVHPFKLTINDNHMDGKLISLPAFVNNIGKPSLNSLEILFDNHWYIPDLTARTVFVNVFMDIRLDVDRLFLLDKSGMFNTLRGQLATRMKQLPKAPKPEKEFMHFMRMVQIIKALETNSPMKEYIITDGSLRVHLENRETVEFYTEKMSTILKDLNELESSGAFKQPANRQIIADYHANLIKGYTH